jgi:hypothetical protein
MRRLLLITLLACLAAAAAAVTATADIGDGTLAVRAAAGTLRLDIEGAAIGRLEGGQVEVIAQTIDDCRDLDVWGADRTRTRIKATGATSCLFTDLVDAGTPQPIRFRLALDAGTTLIVRSAASLSLSAVGQGRGTIKGTDGTYSLNGGKFLPLPAVDPVSFRLGGTLE